MDGATASLLEKRGTALRSGGTLSDEDFHLNNVVSLLGGIHEVRRVISRGWTIEEVEDFRGAWYAQTDEVREALMGGGEDAEDRMRNFTATLDVIHEEGLMFIAVKCYACCLRNDVRLALAFDSEPYFRQTLADLEGTLPPAFTNQLRVMMQLCRETNKGINELGEKQDRAADVAAQTNALVKAHMTPRPADYKVTQGQLCDILAGLNCARTEMTIQRWEKYLSTDGSEGTKPPSGYTLQTRLTSEAATAWAKSFAAAEKSKLNVKCSLERLTGGRR